MWHGPGGLRRVLIISFPLMLSTSSLAVRMFCDRLMLSQVSSEAMSAGMMGGLTAFSTKCAVIGVIWYASTFVAQYLGEGRDDHLGPVVWQAVVLGLVTGLGFALAFLWAEPLFAFFGHDPAVQVLEARYYSIVLASSPFDLVAVALSAFWSGRGKTSTMMYVSFVGAGLNIALNWLLIYGHWGLPELGVAGAALGTACSEVLAMVIYLVLFLRRREYREHFAAWPPRLWHPALLGRMLRFGLPSGFHIAADVWAFNIFLALMGRLGVQEQEASTMAFALNEVAFLPMMGIGTAASVMVGQNIGARDIPTAREAVRNAALLVCLYMGTWALLYVFLPDQLLGIFKRPDDPAQTETLATARLLLRYVAAYVLFDGLNITYRSALQGAGDTQFVMWLGIGLSWLLLALPSYLLWRFDAAISDYWGVLVGYVVMAGAVFYWRYRQGRWEGMKVTEEDPPAADA